jgi:multidrug efflux pump subunit AcrA (membrane-fusion protein)
MSAPSTAGRALRLLILVPLARLRFLFILGAIMALILYWDVLVAHYEKCTRPAGSTAAVDPDHEFYCPMHPTVIRDTNKEKCPICFMPLSKRKKGEQTDEALPAGTVSRVQLSPYRVVLAGVATVPVGYHQLSRPITTVGTIEFDERNLKAVAARVKSRIETLHVNQTGQMVHAGDPLAVLYSPDLVVTVQNLLDARAAGNTALEATTRDRLTLWGLDAREIDEVLKSGQPITRLTVRSPITGHVLRKYPREGQYVEEGGPLFDVADLSTIWVQARLYEDDLALLPAGSHDPATGKPDYKLPVSATARAFPGRTFDGVLTFLFPHVDPDTRTLTARFELPNPDHELRPGMTATVTLKLTAELLAATPAGKRLKLKEGQVLAVPETVVIDTGRQKVVYRESLPNTFDGVLVELGPRMTAPDGGTYFPVYAGLAEGDRVVTAGSFLIDAETRLNPALGSVYIGGSGGKSGPGPTVRPSTPDDEEAIITAALAKLSPADRKLAEEQKWCAVLDGSRLGSMGVPLKLTLKGRPVFVCCKGCVKPAEANPDAAFERIEKQRKPAVPGPSPKTDREQKIRASLARLAPADRALAEAQKLCPVAEEPLGSMGVPVKHVVNGVPVFICCESCDGVLRESPDEVLKKVAEFKARSKRE